MKLNKTKTQKAPKKTAFIVPIIRRVNRRYVYGNKILRCIKEKINKRGNSVG